MNARLKPMYVAGAALAAALTVMGSAGAASAGTCPAVVKATMELAAAYKVMIQAETVLKQVKAGADKSITLAEAERRADTAHKLHKEKIAASNAAFNSCR